MIKELNRVEKELNTIRMALYEEIKDMNPLEMTTYMKAQTTLLHKKYNIHPIRITTPVIKQKAL